jgi:hypothetical protein
MFRIILTITAKGYPCFWLKSGEKLADARLWRYYCYGGGGLTITFGKQVLVAGGWVVD